MVKGEKTALSGWQDIAKGGEIQSNSLYKTHIIVVKSRDILLLRGVERQVEPKQSASMIRAIKNPEMSDAGKNWNVVMGCDKYSDGCLNCYAEDIVDWLKGMGQKVYKEKGFNLTLHHDKLDWPLRKLAKKPRRPVRTFVTDMGDLFHEKVPDDFITLGP